MPRAISTPQPVIICPLSKAIAVALVVQGGFGTPSLPYGANVRGNDPSAQEYGSTPVFGPFVPMTSAGSRHMMAS